MQANLAQEIIKMQAHKIRILSKIDLDGYYLMQLINSYLRQLKHVIYFFRMDCMH